MTKIKWGNIVNSFKINRNFKIRYASSLQHFSLYILNIFSIISPLKQVEIVAFLVAF
jgi:hypothetical protein